MFLSTHKTFLIIVLAYLTLECAAIECQKIKKCRQFVAECLNRIAAYYKISLETHIKDTYHEEDLNFKVITSLQCAKNAIKLLVDPGEKTNLKNRYYYVLKDNLNPRNVVDKSTFCDYKKPKFTLFDLNKRRAKDCMHNAKQALEYAIMNVTLEKFDGQEYATSYMNHLIDNVLVKGSKESRVEPVKNCEDEYKKDKHQLSADTQEN